MKSPIYKFSSTESTGIDKVPVNGFVLIQNGDSAPTQIVLKDKAGISSTTKIKDILNNSKNVEHLNTGVQIMTPAITYPVDGATGIVGSIMASDYKPSATFAGSHTATDWEFTNLATGEVEISISNSTEYLTSLPLSLFKLNTQYQGKVRYKSGMYASNWSSSVTFTTASSGIMGGVISVQNNNTCYLIAKTSDTYYEGSVTAKLAQISWQIVDSGGNVVYSLDVTDLTDPASKQLTIDRDVLSLNFDSDYTVEAQYIYKDSAGNTYTSDWNKKQFHVGLYKIDKLKDKYVYSDGAKTTFTITHDGGKPIDTSIFGLSAAATSGTMETNGDQFTYTSPPVTTDINVTINVAITENGTNVSNVLSMPLKIYSIHEMVSDDLVIDDNFSEYGAEQANVLIKEI